MGKGKTVDEDEMVDVDALMEELAIATKGLAGLKIENAALKREVDCWHRRAERAEKDVIRWKTTAEEWRAEFTRLVAKWK